jgi:hypothetical protein
MSSAAILSPGKGGRVLRIKIDSVALFELGKNLSAIPGVPLRFSPGYPLQRLRRSRENFSTSNPKQHFKVVRRQLTNLVDMLIVDLTNALCHLDNVCRLIPLAAKWNR